MIWRLETDNQEKFSHVYVVVEHSALTQLRIFFIVFSPRIGIKASVWSRHSETSWLNTYRFLELNAPGSEMKAVFLSFFLSFFVFLSVSLSLIFTCLFVLTLLDGCFWEIRETSGSLLAKAKRHTRKARDVSAVTVSWLSQGCPVAGFSFLLCGHVFPIRQGCVTPGVGQFMS